MGLLDFFKMKTNSSKVIDDVKMETNVISNDNHSYTEEEKKVLFLYSMDYPMKVLDNNNYARKFQYEFNISNCKQIHEDLIKDGYFEIANFDDFVKQYKVNEIKELLNEFNIKFDKEKKDQLIELAKNNISQEEKKELSKKLGIYVLSDTARNFIAQYEDLIYIYNHKDWAIPYWLFKEYKKKMETYFKRGDIIWAIFGDRLSKSNNSTSNLRGIYNDMAEFLEEENKFTEALRYYVSVCYLDVNQCSVQDYLKHYRPNGLMTKKEILESIEESPIYEKLLNKIYKLSQYHNDKIFEKIYSNIKLSYELLTEDEFKEMIMNIYECENFDCEKYIKLANNRLAKIIKNY